MMACVARLVPMAVAALVLAGCQSAGDGTGLRGPATSFGLATTVPQPKDFVVASRPTGDLAYVPVGRGGVDRPINARNVAASQELERDLDRAREQSSGFARRALPRPAFGRPFPSVAAPRSAPPAAGQPASFPVSAGRAERMRQDAERARRAAPQAQ